MLDMEYVWGVSCVLITGKKAGKKCVTFAKKKHVFFRFLKK